MQPNAGDAGRRKHRKTSKKKSNRKAESMRRPRPHAGGAAVSAPTLSDHSTQAKPSKPALPGGVYGIESQLQVLKSTAQAYRKPHHREAAMLVIATAGCFLIPASAGHLLLSLQDWAFLLTVVLLVTWLLVRMRRYHEVLNMHFDKGLARINQAVADPSERLVYRSKMAKLRIEWLAPRKFFESGSSLLAALVLYAVALVAAHSGSWMR
jgi:Flp pilus assembly protein TadB